MIWGASRLSVRAPSTHRLPHLEQLARAFVPVLKVGQHLLLADRLDPGPVPDSIVFILRAVGYERHEIEDGVVLDGEDEGMLRYMCQCARCDARKCFTPPCPLHTHMVAVITLSPTTLRASSTSNSPRYAYVPVYRCVLPVAPSKPCDPVHARVTLFTPSHPITASTSTARVVPGQSR
jgi:hypothetical protein